MEKAVWRVANAMFDQDDHRAYDACEVPPSPQHKFKMGVYSSHRILIVGKDERGKKVESLR